MALPRCHGLGRATSAPSRPLHAEWDPRVGAGTLPALARGGPRRVVVRRPGASGCRGAGCCSRRSAAGSPGCLASPWSTAGGVGRSSDTEYEYLRTARATTDLRPCFRSTSLGSRSTAPDTSTQLAGARRRTSAGSAAFFVLLARLGLGSGLAAGLVVTLIAASTAVAVLVTLRRSVRRGRARAAPFLVLGPAAIWRPSAPTPCSPPSRPGGRRARRRGDPPQRAVGPGGRAAARLLRDAVLRPAAARHPRPGHPGGGAQRGGPCRGRCRPRCVVLGLRRSGFLWWEALPVLLERYWAGVGEPPPVRVLDVGQPRRARLQRGAPGRRRAGRLRSAGARPRLGATRSGWSAGSPAPAWSMVAARRRLGDEQGRGRADLAAVRALAAGRLRPAPDAGGASASRSRCSSPLVVQHLLFTGW